MIGKEKNTGIATLPRGFLTMSKRKIYRLAVHTKLISAYLKLFPYYNLKKRKITIANTHLFSISLRIMHPFYFLIPIKLVKIINDMFVRFLQHTKGKKLYRNTDTEEKNIGEIITYIANVIVLHKSNLLISLR